MRVFQEYHHRLSHHTSEVLQLLEKHQLYLIAEKRTFLQSTIQFLGYPNCSHGVQRNNRKVETIRAYQRFFGNFYRHLKQFHHNSTHQSPKIQVHVSVLEASILRRHEDCLEGNCIRLSHGTAGFPEAYHHGSRWLHIRSGSHSVPAIVESF